MKARCGPPLFFRVEYRDAKGVVSAGNDTTVTFTGKNERPTAEVSPDETNPSVADHAEEAAATRRRPAPGPSTTRTAPPSCWPVGEGAVRGVHADHPRGHSHGAHRRRQVRQHRDHADGTWDEQKDAAKLMQVQLHGNQPTAPAFPSTSACQASHGRKVRGQETQDYITRMKEVPREGKVRLMAVGTGHPRRRCRGVLATGYPRRQDQGEHSFRQRRQRW